MKKFLIGLIAVLVVANVGGATYLWWLLDKKASKPTAASLQADAATSKRH